MEFVVTKEHHVDASEQRKDGSYDFYYAYELYTFETKERQLSARQYDEEPEEASFFRFRKWRKSPRGWGKSEMLDEIPYDDLLFRKAARYLIDEEGVSQVRVLLREGHVAIDSRRVT